MNKFLIKTLFQRSFPFVSEAINIRQLNDQTHFHPGQKKAECRARDIPKNMSLTYCPALHNSNHGNGVKMKSDSVKKLRPLTIIMVWLLAEDKHIEIYRQLWFKRGFDVLTVKTTPRDVLFPRIGAQVLAKNLVGYLSEISPDFYEEIIIHTFSVGGYLFMEMNERLISSEEYRGFASNCQRNSNRLFGIA